MLMISRYKQKKNSLGIAQTFLAQAHWNREGENAISHYIFRQNQHMAHQHRQGKCGKFTREIFQQFSALEFSFVLELVLTRSCSVKKHQLRLIESHLDENYSITGGKCEKCEWKSDINCEKSKTHHKTQCKDNKFGSNSVKVFLFLW